jgi:hypothetical protein
VRPSDTSPEAWRILLNIYQRMTPDEKLQRTLDMSDFLRSVCASGVRAEYPEASEREVFLRVTQRTLGKDLFAKVYGANALPQ